MSETTNLKLKKHDDVLENTNAFNIEEYLNDNWGKIDENIEQINEKIKQNSNNIESLQADNTTNKKRIEELKQKNAEQDESIKTNASEIEELKQENIEIKAENERLRDDIKSIALVGEESGESIDLEDSSGARFKKFGISGNHSQETREGYNLLDMRNAKGGTSNGITCEINADGSVKYTGTATSNAINVFFLGAYGENAATLFTLKPGTYYIKDVNLYNKTIGINPTKNKYIWTIEEETNVTAVRAPQADTGKTYNETIYPIVSSSNKAVDYEQYGATPSLEFPSEITTVKDNINEVICNKNLLNQYKIVPYYINGENKVQSWEGEVESLYIQIKSNTAYTVSKKISARFTIATSTEVPRVGLTVNVVSNRQANKLTITSKNEDKYLMIFYYKKTDDTLSSQEIISSIQVEEGTVATAYVKHQSQSIAMPVQQEMLKGDYFDWVNEKEVHKWAKLIFDGTENWLQSGNVYPTFYISPDEIASKFGIPTNLKALCNYFTQKSNIWGIDEIGFDIANLRPDHVDFRFCLGSNSTITTLEAWKNKLVEMYNSGNPLVLYFQIFTQDELDFTDEQKVVAKKIKETLHTYKNITHIYSTDETGPIMNVEYAKDPNTQNNNLQNQIDEIKQLISTTQTSAMLLDNLQKEVESEVE
jgi:hypothetical protein